MNMNRDRIEGNWKQLKGNIQHHWGKLTDDQLAVVLGKRIVIAGQIQEICGIARDVKIPQINMHESLNNISL
jgi:uncharacterized protein YjbJ (UPF0337 family)